MWSRVEIIFKEAFVSMRRHVGLGMATVFCIVCVLLFAGILGVIYLNANYAMNSVISDVRFDVIFKMPTGETRDASLAAFEKIKALDGISSAQFVTSEEAWERQQKIDPELFNLLDGENPLPDKATVKPKNIDQVNQLKKEIGSWEEVMEISAADETVGKLQTMRGILSNIGLILITIALIVSLVLIFHTIQLAIYSRKKEINIMSLVGAAPSTIIASFVVEGVMYGVYAAIFAFLLLFGLYSFAETGLLSIIGPSAELMQFSGVQYLYGFLILLFLAVILGFIGSFISADKYIRSPKSRITNS